MNLLKETIEILKENNLTAKDVAWVGCRTFKTSWENFTHVANVDYYNGFGGAEVATDLLIVGKDWWLERHEYDGAEQWELKKLPEEPDMTVTIGRVASGTWTDLHEMNQI